MDWAETTATREDIIKVLGFGASCIRDFTVDQITEVDFATKYNQNERYQNCGETNSTKQTSIEVVIYMSVSKSEVVEIWPVMKCTQ